ncbi:MAG: hypothetical protein JWN46_2109, partial [Acidimicrobiales bacterium]|nr:hypothetical protein [Acidimicrobiales bacterium]
PGDATAQAVTRVADAAPAWGPGDVPTTPVHSPGPYTRPQPMPELDPFAEGDPFADLQVPPNPDDPTQPVTRQPPPRRRRRGRPRS